MKLKEKLAQEYADKHSHFDNHTELAYVTGFEKARAMAVKVWDEYPDYVESFERSNFLNIGEEEVVKPFSELREIAQHSIDHGRREVEGISPHTILQLIDRIEGLENALLDIGMHNPHDPQICTMSEMLIQKARIALTKNGEDKELE